jgi:hypothetical protein
LTPRELTALRAVHDRHHDATARRWAIERAAFANVHFRKVDGGQYQDAPFILDDFLGTGDHHGRSLELQQSRREIAHENIRLAKLKRNSKLEGGGSSRIEKGKVIVTGMPDVFRQLQEKHDAEQAAKVTAIAPRPERRIVPGRRK